MSSTSSTQQHEPTMEEILASIRKIISEDQTEAAPAPVTVSRPVAVASVAPMQVEEQPEEVDVLELTHEVHEEEPAHEAEPAPQPEPEYEHEEAAHESQAGSEVPAEDDVAFEDADEQTEEPEVAGEDIIPETARRAMSKAFEPYDRQGDAHAPVMPTVEGGHLEAVFTRAILQSFDPVLRDWMNHNTEAVVQHMKPLIREWMDENLPDLIERAVKSEMSAAVRSLTKKR